MEQKKFKIKTKKGIVELMAVNDKVFLFEKGEVKKISSKIENSSLEELDKELANKKDSISIDQKVFETLKKEYGTYELIF